MTAPSEHEYDLSLLAIDSEDLSIVSTHLQNAVVRVGEMIYQPHDQRFVLLAARYDWMRAHHDTPMRVRAGVHFDHVTRVTHIGVDQNTPNMALNLQSLLFKPMSSAADGDSTTSPDLCAGQILLAFQNGATIRLEVECIEAQMRDIGPRWPTRHAPEDGIDDRPADVI